MRKKNVVIALPAYTGQVHISTMKSLLFDIMQLAKRGDSISVQEQSGNALIGDCRAIIVQLFLSNPHATHLVMVDSDVCWQAGGIAQLVDHGVDFVCGMYPVKREPLTFNMRSAMERGEGLFVDPQNGLVEVWGVPAGFVCLSRVMLEKMIAAYPETEFKVENKDCPGGKAYALFDPYRVPGTTEKLGEDYAFCARWRDIGGKVWIDPNICMGHIGWKTYSGELGQCLAPENEEAA